MKTNFKKIIILLLLTALAGGGFYSYKIKEQVPKNQLLLYGNVDIRQVQLAFQENGRLEKLYVQEGDRVKKGDLLAEIDAVRYTANLNKARADLAAQQQVVKRMKAGSRPQEIARAGADVRAWKARFKDAGITLHRLQRLVKKQATSQQKVDDAATAYQAAKEGLEAARQALELIRIGPREEDIAAAVAKEQAVKSVVIRAEKELADTKLHAPVTGVIRDRIMEPGDMAFPNTPVLTLARTNPLWIRVYVPETDLGKIVPGMQADVSTDSYPDKIYRGWIGYISPTAEFTPKNVETAALRTRLVYQARIFVCNPADELRLGMPATVQIDLLQKKTKGPISRQNVCPDS
ncbi:MAG TPA: HlyD family efflux transporter periplasmic adaptor subunit [Desulfobulbaceae bacterium]|nr:HlyD family efflux transporter periplasmic adaptor subunit [Desulfobulbaceae bacterium]